MKFINVMGRPSVLFVILALLFVPLKLTPNVIAVPLLLAICYEIGRYRGNKVGLKKGNEQGLEKARVDYVAVSKKAHDEGFELGVRNGRSEANGMPLDCPPDNRSAHVLATSYSFAGLQFLMFRNINTGKVTLHRFDAGAYSWFGEGVQPKVHRTYVWMPDLSRPPEKDGRQYYKLADIGDQGSVEQHDLKPVVATT